LNDTIFYATTLEHESLRLGGLQKLATRIHQPKENTMKTLKNLGAAMALTFVFAFAAFADCVPPLPGEMNTPPCTGTQITPDDPAPPGETSTPPNTEDVFSISQATVDVLLGALSIF
jgi:hypothetical protein